MSFSDRKAIVSALAMLTLGVFGIARQSGDQAAVENLFVTLQTGKESVGAKPDVSLPHLLELLQDENAKTRIGAMQALRRLAEQHDEDVLKKQPKIRAKVIDYAVANLTSENPRQRQHAADLFRTLVPDDAEKIIPVLIRLMKERAIASRDVGHMLSGQGEYGMVHDDLRNRALPTLVATFADASPGLHADLVELLAGHHYRFNIEWLPDALAHKDARIRAGAAATARRALSNKKIVQALRGLLKDAELLVRVYAAAALAVHDRNGAPEPVVSSLIEGLRQGPPAMRFESVSHLRYLGKNAVPATAALLDALNDSDFQVRQEAAQVLLNLDRKHAKRVLLVVQKSLRDQPKGIEPLHPVFDLAKQLGKDALPLAPDLVAVMQAEPMWTGRVAEILGTFGADSEARRAIPTLQKWLYDHKGLGSFNEWHQAADLAHVCVALAKLGAPEHARATRLLLPITNRGRVSYVRLYYFPHYPDETVRELTKLLGEPTLRSDVLRTFVQIGAEGEKKLTPAVKDDLEKSLRKLLDEKDLTLRASVGKAMREMQFTVPAEKLDALIRECVASKEHQIAPLRDLIDGNEKTAIPLMIDEAVNQDDRYRFYSVYKPKAIPMLLQIARSGSSQQCMQAAWGLATISLGTMSDESRADAIKTLLARLPDLKSPARGEVAMAILRLGIKAPPTEAIVAVGESLADKNLKNPARVVGDLRYFAGKRGAPVADHLRLALAHANPHVQLEAATFLAEIDIKHAREILPVIRKTLEGQPKEGLPESDRHFGMALEVCVMLGKEASPLLPRLLEIHRTRNDHFAILAGQTAVAIDKDHVPEIGKNLALLVGRSPLLTREQAAMVLRLLREWGTSAAGADTHLTPLMRQNRHYARYEYAATLMMLQGPNAAKGVEQMRRGLGNTSSDSDCREALQQFAVLNSQGKIFLPELRILLDSPDELYREQAVRAIAAIGPDAKELLPELHRLVKDEPADSLRQTLVDAIKAVSK